jgi:hypothetical protein
MYLWGLVSSYSQNVLIKVDPDWVDVGAGVFEGTGVGVSVTAWVHVAEGTLVGVSVFIGVSEATGVSAVPVIIIVGDPPGVTLPAAESVAVCAAASVSEAVEAGVLEGYSPEAVAVAVVISPSED